MRKTIAKIMFMIIIFIYTQYIIHTVHYIHIINEVFHNTPGELHNHSY